MTVFHPLAADPTELSDKELTERISKLMKQMLYAQRNGNIELFEQSSALYQMYADENQRRILEELHKTNDDDGNGADFDDIIDIG